MRAAVRFGIIGCGMIAAHHARAIHALRGLAELVAVADRHADRAARLACEHGVAAYRSLEALLRHPGLDAVCICTPSGEHAAQAIAALEAGKHVVIEKPADVSLAAIDRIAAARRAPAQKITVISQHRFDRSTQLVREAVRAGHLGRLTLGAAQVRWWRPQSYYDARAWRGTWRWDGGGALMNQSIHTIDLLQWLMGPVVEVSAYSACLAHERIEVEDTAVAAVRFAGGALGIIAGTTAAYPGLTARLEIHGDHGSAIIDNDELIYFHSAVLSTGTPDEPINQAARLLGYAPAMPAASAGANPANLSTAHQEQLRDFVTAILEDREPLVTLEEGRKPVEIILAIYASARRGRPVRLPLEERAGA